MNPRWIDAHCHLADSRYSTSDLDQIIQRSYAAHIYGWVQGGTCPADWDRQLDIQDRFGPGIITSFGLHPRWVAQSTEAEVKKALIRLEQDASQTQAIGELGLDLIPRFHTPECLDLQTLAFQAQLDIAKAIKKPLILHIVRAHPEVIRILKKRAPFPESGIVHSFSGNLEAVQEYLELGFLISMSGSITKRGFQKLKKAITSIPKEKIVVETDSPDQTPDFPEIQANDLNEPANLIGIAKVLADFYKTDYSEILSTSTQNIEQLFGVNI